MDVFTDILPEVYTWFQNEINEQTKLSNYSREGVHVYDHHSKITK